MKKCYPLVMKGFSSLSNCFFYQVKPVFKKHFLPVSFPAVDPSVGLEPHRSLLGRGPRPSFSAVLLLLGFQHLRLHDIFIILKSAGVRINNWIIAGLRLTLLFILLSLVSPYMCVAQVRVWGCISVCSQSNLCTWDAWALERVWQCHADLGHAVAFQQCVSCNLLPALQSGKRKSSRAGHHQPGGRGPDVRETIQAPNNTLLGYTIP